MSRGYPPQDPPRGPGRRDGRQPPGREPDAPGGYRPGQAGWGAPVPQGPAPDPYGPYGPYTPGPHGVPPYPPERPGAAGAGGRPPAGPDPRDPRWRGPGAPVHPAERSSSKLRSLRPQRTDPTLYEWDRLTPEQQRAVLATIGRSGVGMGPQLRRLIIPIAVAVGLLAALIIVFLLLRGS